MKKVLLILLPLVVIAGIIIGSGYYIYDNIIDTNLIYEGVKINNYHVGNKTKEEALLYVIQQIEENDRIKSMQLTLDDKYYDISLSDIGYTYNYEEAVYMAYNLGREGNILDRYIKIRNLKKNGEAIILTPKYDRNLVVDKVEEIASDIDQDCKDAEFHFNDGNINIVEEKVGRKVKKDQLIRLIEDNIFEFEDISIPVEIEMPELTKAMLSRINGVIGEYSTSFKGSSAGRIHNIKLSAESLNGKLILPGEEISYNETTGPRQAKFGYQEAPVILNGELTPGIGGGVCQTSTTLYNALLLSDITITERHPHSIPPAYVPRGRDGAVATGYLDLKFRNDFDFPIYIHSKVIGDRVYFYIYGDISAKDYSIRIEPELIETIPYKTQEIFDENLEPGTRQLVQEGRTGYKVRTYKSIIKNGTVIKREQITFDYYRERDYIYKVGPEPVNNEAEAIHLDPVESEEAVDLLP